jgi:hypothetical protein
MPDKFLIIRKNGDLLQKNRIIAKVFFLLTARVGEQLDLDRII